MSTHGTEQELLARARHSPEAFGQLYDRYYPAILNYVVRRTGNIEAAKDITAETFVKALSAIGRFEWRGSSFGAWLYRIAGNELATYVRKGKYTAISLEHLQETQGLEPVSATEVEAELIAAQETLTRHQQFLTCLQHVRQLPVIYQEVIGLRFFADRSIKEIAEILRKPEGTVKSLLHRGLDRLRTALEVQS